MERIKETIAAVLQNLTDKKGIAGEEGAPAALKKVLTKKEMEHIKFKYFKNGVVYLAVDSSAWLYRLSLQKKGITDRLKHELEAVKEIRFYIGDTE